MNDKLSQRIEMFRHMYFQGAVAELFLSSIATKQPVPVLLTAQRYLSSQQAMLAKKARLKPDDCRAIIDLAEQHIITQLASQNQLATEEETVTESEENHGQV
jgi:hypothetical protein